MLSVAHFRSVLGGQRRIDRIEPGRVDGNAGQHGADDARIGEIDDDVLDRRHVQALEHEVEDLEVGLESFVTVDLGAELQGLAGRPGPGGARAQHRAAVAEPGHSGTVEHVRIDSRRLRRAVGAQAEGSAAQLIDELERLQVEGVAGARKERLDVLQHRRDDELEAEARSGVEQAATQRFDVAGARRKDIGDVLRQEPGRGHAKSAAC